jgi:hypothetical protein
MPVVMPVPVLAVAIHHSVAATLLLPGVAVETTLQPWASEVLEALGAAREALHWLVLEVVMAPMVLPRGPIKDQLLVALQMHSPLEEKPTALAVAVAVETVASMV